jgi:hypothetical protein
VPVAARAPSQPGLPQSAPIPKLSWAARVLLLLQYAVMRCVDSRWHPLPTFLLMRLFSCTAHMRSFSCTAHTVGLQPCFRLGAVARVSAWQLLEMGAAGCTCLCTLSPIVLSVNHVPNCQLSIVRKWCASGVRCQRRVTRTTAPDGRAAGIIARLLPVSPIVSCQ